MHKVQQGLCVLNESQIFFCPACSNAVNKHFIIWLLSVENSKILFQPKEDTRKLQKFNEKDFFTSTLFLCFFFFWISEQETHNSLKNASCFSFFFHVLFPLSFCPVSVGPDSVFRTGPLQPIGGFTDQLSHSHGILWWQLFT